MNLGFWLCSLTLENSGCQGTGAIPSAKKLKPSLKVSADLGRFLAPWTGRLEAGQFFPVPADREDSLVLSQDWGHCSWWAQEALNCWESDMNTSLMASEVLLHCWALQPLCCQQGGVLGWILWHPRIQMFLYHLTEIFQVQSLPSLQVCQSQYGNITMDLMKVYQYSDISTETFWIQLIYMLYWCTCQCWVIGWIWWSWRDQFGQAQFALRGAVLDHSSVLHVPQHCFH